MARKVVTALIDDVDGSEAERTVTFAFEGVSYEIDLSRGNAEAFEGAISPWIEKARKVSNAATRKRGVGRSGGSRVALDDVRRWARENGYEVSERGRVPNAVHDAYAAAH